MRLTPPLAKNLGDLAPNSLSIPKRKIFFKEFFDGNNNFRTEFKKKLKKDFLKYSTNNGGIDLSSKRRSRVLNKKVVPGTVKNQIFMTSGYRTAKRRRSDQRPEAADGAGKAMSGTQNLSGLMGEIKHRSRKKKLGGRARLQGAGPAIGSLRGIGHVAPIDTRPAMLSLPKKPLQVNPQGVESKKLKNFKNFRNDGNQRLNLRNSKEPAPLTQSLEQDVSNRRFRPKNRKKKRNLAERFSLKPDQIQAKLSLKSPKNRDSTDPGRFDRGSGLLRGNNSGQKVTEFLGQNSKVLGSMASLKHRRTGSPGLDDRRRPNFAEKSSQKENRKGFFKHKKISKKKYFKEKEAKNSTKEIFKQRREATQGDEPSLNRSLHLGAMRSVPAVLRGSKAAGASFESNDASRFGLGQSKMFSTLNSSSGKKKWKWSSGHFKNQLNSFVRGTSLAANLDSSKGHTMTQNMSLNSTSYINLSLGKQKVNLRNGAPGGGTGAQNPLRGTLRSSSSQLVNESFTNVLEMKDKILKKVINEKKIKMLKQEVKRLKGELEDIDLEMFNLSVPKVNSPRPNFMVKDNIFKTSISPPSKPNPGSKTKGRHNRLTLRRHMSASNLDDLKNGSNLGIHKNPKYPKEDKTGATPSGYYSNNNRKKEVGHIFGDNTLGIFRTVDYSEYNSSKPKRGQKEHREPSLTLKRKSEFRNPSLQEFQKNSKNSKKGVEVETEILAAQIKEMNRKHHILMNEHHFCKEMMKKKYKEIYKKSKKALKKVKFPKDCVTHVIKNKNLKKRFLDLKENMQSKLNKRMTELKGYGFKQMETELEFMKMRLEGNPKLAKTELMEYVKELGVDRVRSNGLLARINGG